VRGGERERERKRERERDRERDKERERERERGREGMTKEKVSGTLLHAWAGGGGGWDDSV
jgi:hypothetical protein